MPTIQFDTEIEIEVYCATCRTGLCNETESTEGMNRGVRQFRVQVCYNCMKEKQVEIEDLQTRIEALEEEIDRLNNN